MTLKDIDATVRENALQMLGSDALNARYITALNMIRASSKGMSPGMLRLKPEAVKTAKKEVREPL
jgi:hypothetical protein